MKTPLHLAWRDYQGRRLLAWGVALLFLPGAWADASLPGNAIPGVLLFMAWIVLAGAAGARLMAFPCPACGQGFFWRGWYYDRHARKCLHCGLPKYADPTVRAALRLKSTRLRL